MGQWADGKPPELVQDRAALKATDIAGLLGGGRQIQPKAVCSRLADFMSGNYYRQAIPDLGLSIEKDTDRVSSDGKYHVLKDGELLGTFRFLKQAQELYNRIVQESGYKPQVKSQRKTSAQLDVERYLEAKEFYWADSHKYRGGGGRGRRGGV